MSKQSQKKVLISFTIVIFIYLLFIQLNVTKLHNLTKKDPLFYDPSLDSHELSKGISELKKSENDLLLATAEVLSEKTLNNTAQEKEVINSIVTNGILPIDYLEELTKNLKRNEIFIEKPNLINAVLLLIQTQKTADFYRKESQKLLSLAEASAKVEGSLSRPYQVHLFGSRSTTIQEYKDIQLINQNSLVLQNDSYSRWKCLLLGMRCGEQIRNVTPEKKSKSPRVTATILPTEITMQNYTFDKMYGPYLIESSCFPKKYTWLQFVIDDKNRFIAKDATENYYYDIDNRIISSSTQNDYLSDIGMPYDFQNESTSYRCLDLRYWADLSSLAVLEDLMKEKSPTSTDGLRDLETQYPDTFTFEQLITLDNKLTHLPYMLRSIATYLDIYTDIQKDYRNRLEILQLVANRSTYALTYQTFSRSIWRLQENPAYTSVQNIAVPSLYTTYTELSNIYTAEEIKDFHE
jgi:hypothetical protein